MFTMNLFLYSKRINYDFEYDSSHLQPKTYPTFLSLYLSLSLSNQYTDLWDVTVLAAAVIV